MLKLSLGKVLSRWPMKHNHYIILESQEQFIKVELAYSKSIQPYPGGILEYRDIVMIKEFLDEVLSQVI